MEKDIKNGKREKNMWEILLTVKKMEKEKKNGQMVKNMKEILKMD